MFATANQRFGKKEQSMIPKKIIDNSLPIMNYSS